MFICPYIDIWNPHPFVWGFTESDRLIVDDQGDGAVSLRLFEAGAGYQYEEVTVMTDAKQSETAWKPCKTGEVSGLVGQLRSRRRTAQLWRAGRIAASAAALLLVTVVLPRLIGPTVYTYGTLTCTETQELAADYFAGTLDDELQDRVKIHLTRCPVCAPLAEKMLKDRNGNRRSAIPGKTWVHVRDIDGAPARVLASID